MSPFMHRSRPLGLGLVLLLGAVASVAQLRVATWNITTYTGDAGRDAAIQTAVYGEYEGRSFSPDVIIAQEIISYSAATHFRDLLNTAPNSPGDWEMQFQNGPYEGAVVFYRTSRVDYFAPNVIVHYGGSYPEGPRNAVRFRLRLKDYISHEATLFCYCSHMKAGDSSQDRTRRLSEAQDIADDAEWIPDDYCFVLGADLNMQSSGESGYQALVAGEAGGGPFYDPVNRPGTWRDVYSMRFVHSQDPYNSMDDRYDQLLVSASLIDGEYMDYIGDASIPFSSSTWDDPNHSHRSWGNDGTSYNTSLTTIGNSMVGADIAQALRTIATSSYGHLPVYIDLRVPAEIDSDEIVDFGQVPQGSVAEANVIIWNAGDEDRWSLDGIADLEYTLSATAGFGAPGGTFVDPAGDQGNVHVLTMDTSAQGVITGTLTINSNAPDERVREVTLTGEVIGPEWCLGDLDCSYGPPNFQDILYFVAALNGESAWEDYYRSQHGGADPACPWLLGDFDYPLNGVEFSDISPFANSVGQGCIPFQP